MPDPPGKQPAENARNRYFPNSNRITPVTDLPTDHPLSPLPLARDAPDALLAEAVRRQPGIVVQAIGQVRKAYADALGIPGLARAARASWLLFGARDRQTSEPVTRLRIALQAAAVLRALVKLPVGGWQEYGIGDELAGAIGDTLHIPQSDWRVSARTRAAMAAHPDLAWFQAELDAALVAQAAEWKMAGVGWLDYAWEMRPANLLCDLRRRRIDLALDGQGRLTTPPNTALRVADWIALERHGPALVKLLAAEAGQRLVVA